MKAKECIFSTLDPKNFGLLTPKLETFILVPKCTNAERLVKTLLKTLCYQRSGCMVWSYSRLGWVYKGGCLATAEAGFYSPVALPVAQPTVSKHTYYKSKFSSCDHSVITICIKHMSI